MEGSVQVVIETADRSLQPGDQVELVAVEVLWSDGKIDLNDWHVAGDALIAPSVTARLLSAFAGASSTAPPVQPIDPLTEREEEVLLTVARGRTNTQIADELYISLSTVKTHLASLMAKLHARNRVELAMWAYDLPHPVLTLNPRTPPTRQADWPGSFSPNSAIQPVPQWLTANLAGSGGSPGLAGWVGGQMDRPVAVLDAAVAGESALLARRALGDMRDEADRGAALDALARRAAAGSQFATELLIEALDRWGVARAAVRRVPLVEAAVEDVTQDTLILVAQGITSFRDEPNFTTWLHQLARRCAEDHRRRARATESLDERDLGLAAQMSFLIASRQAVRQLLDQLPDRYRDAVLLRDVERLPYAEVAVRLGRNLKTAKSHAARGRALLAGLIERDPDA